MLSKILYPFSKSFIFSKFSGLYNTSLMSMSNKIPFKKLKTTTDILMLSEKDIKKVFTMKDAIETSKEALKFCSDKKVNIPLRGSLNIPKQLGNALFMYGYIDPMEALGCKIVSVYPKNIEKGIPNVPATMILMNSETGQVNCIMDGTTLTKIRTGALSGAATDILANKNSKIFSLFGAGGQASSQLEAILSVRPIELVKVWDLSKERAKQFVDKMNKEFGDKYNVKIEVAINAKEAVEDADIITTVTTSKTKIFDGKYCKKGVHINGVGSYTPEMSEIDEYIVTHADKIFIDTQDAIKESGDLIKPIKKGIISKENITGEIGDILLGNKKGRIDEDEITFFETVGSAAFDIASGKQIYEKAKMKNMGKLLKL